MRNCISRKYESSRYFQQRLAQRLRKLIFPLQRVNACVNTDELILINTLLVYYQKKPEWLIGYLCYFAPALSGLDCRLFVQCASVLAQQKMISMKTCFQETVSFDDFTSTLETSEAKKAKLIVEKKELSGNGPESLVDIENLDDSRSSLKKLDHLISTPVERTVGGVSELVVSNPPPLPPLDLVSDPS